MVNLVSKDVEKKNILRGLSMYCRDQKLVFQIRNLGKMGDEGNKTLFSSASHHCTSVSKSHNYFRFIPFTT